MRRGEMGRDDNCKAAGRERREQSLSACRRRTRGDGEFSGTLAFDTHASISDGRANEPKCYTTPGAAAKAGFALCSESAPINRRPRPPTWRDCFSASTLCIWIRRTCTLCDDKRSGNQNQVPGDRAVVSEGLDGLEACSAQDPYRPDKPHQAMRTVDAPLLGAQAKSFDCTSEDHREYQGYVRIRNGLRASLYPSHPFTAKKNVLFTTALSVVEYRVSLQFRAASIAQPCGWIPGVIPGQAAMTTFTCAGVVSIRNVLIMNAKPPALYAGSFISAETYFGWIAATEFLWARLIGFGRPFLHVHMPLISLEN